jgi:type IV secretion system protein VirB10
MKNPIVIPSGTKVAVALQHAISTKSAREGDAIYAHTSFPVVANDRLLIPAGTYVQGKIVQVQRAGHVKGRAEILMHFTTLIYPNGYTVMLPGTIDNVPGTENTNMKGSEGTLEQSSQKGKDAEKIATASGKGAEGGALIGALASRSTGGTLAGAGAGAALGAAIALFGRGNDVRLDAGTTVEMVIQRDVTVDGSRVPMMESSVQQVSR